MTVAFLRFRLLTIKESQEIDDRKNERIYDKFLILKQISDILN